MFAFDIYRQWETDLRPITVTALRQLSPEQLHWKPDGFNRSAWDLAVHMAEAEWRWIYRNALRREPWTAKWDADRFGNLDDLLAYWSQIHRTSLEWLHDSPTSELNRKYEMPYIESPYATMNWVLYHVIEHEIHHRGQLFMLMGMQGVKPPQLELPKVASIR